MRQPAVVLVGLFGVACVTAPVATTTGPAMCDPTNGSPPWVTKGSSAFGGDAGKAFYGVGSVGNIMDYSMRRDMAQAKARAAIADILNNYVKKLSKLYNESTSETTKEGTSPQEVQMATQALKNYTDAQLRGVDIVDTFQSKCDTTMFALAKMDFNALKDNMQHAQELNDRMREVIKQRADSAFDELDKEGAKNASTGQ
jgi:hypothetical protein